MSIKIEQVNVKNLGPLNDFPCTFKQVNLFYGHNERGKTYLVEFIYRSIFKNKSLSLRDTSATGQVTLSGLARKYSQFSPSSKKKLEDYWEDSLPGLPRDFSKLLVVKGADLDFASNTPAGIDDKVLKEYLSGEGLLEKISSKIKPTEASATYENGRISGAKTGMLRDYQKIKTEIERIDDAILKVNENISGARRFELERQIEELKKQYDALEQARKHLAYTLSGQISNLKTQLENLPEGLISRVERNIDTYWQKSKELETKQVTLEKNREASKDFQWLELALAEYQKLILTGASLKPNSSLIWIVLSIIAIALTVLMVLIEQPYFAVGLILLAVIFGYFYLRGLTKQQTTLIYREELEKIVHDFETRFGDVVVVEEATMKNKVRELQPFFTSIELLTDDIQLLSNELDNLELLVNKDLNTLLDFEVQKGDWPAIIKKLQVERKNLESNLRNKELELLRLDVDESDYLQDTINVQYDSYRLQTLTNDLKQLRDELKETEDGLQLLKQQVCNITGETIDSSWKNLIENLNSMRQDEVSQYKKVAASILARIKVNEVLGDLRTIEERRIEDGLSSSVISQALKATTGHYDRIEKEYGTLYVGDAYGHYLFSDLSTGAREQVLLGLRIGFASMLLAGTPLFLILDDAFQHSDWIRRVQLVDTLFDLANDGWQIIYFTMDDHIRTLFESKAKLTDFDQYQTINLP